MSDAQRRIDFEDPYVREHFRLEAVQARLSVAKSLYLYDVQGLPLERVQEIVALVSPTLTTDEYRDRLRQWAEEYEYEDDTILEAP